MMQFYKSQHDTVHVANNPYKMLCGRILKEGQPMGRSIFRGEKGIFGSVHIPNLYICPICRRRAVRDRKVEAYWIEVKDVGEH